MPGMDKACKNRIDTVRRLMAAKSADVDLIVAAPVYDPDEYTVDEFLDMRDQSENILAGLLSRELPDVVVGTTVVYRDSLLSEYDIVRLGFAGSCFILSVKDVPYSGTVEAVLHRLSATLGMRVVLCDAGEGFLQHSDRLKKLGVSVVVGLDSLEHRKQINALMPYIDNGLIRAIGSDWESDRPYKYLRKVESRLGDNFDRIMNRTARLLGAEDFAAAK